MYLIEYKEGKFINGENIGWLLVTERGIRFTTRNDPNNIIEVSSPLLGEFVTALVGLDSNSKLKNKQH